MTATTRWAIVVTTSLLGATPQWVLPVIRYGAKTVNKWRKDFLDDLKARMDRCL